MAKSDLLRRKPTRDRYRRMLLVCEGEVTEPKYFQYLRHTEKIPITLEIKTDTPPKRLVELAAELKKKAERTGDADDKFDAVWCVFDIDKHPLVPEATQQAKANGIELAVSNPCFELWALLHFQDQTAYIDGHAVRRAFRKHMPRYEKELPCSELLERHHDASCRARALKPNQNPSTGVYVLVEKIRSYRRPPNR